MLYCINVFSHPNDNIDYTNLGDSCLATFGGHIQPFLVLEGYEGKISYKYSHVFVNFYIIFMSN